MLKNESLEQRVLSLAAFAAGKTDNGVKIKEMGEVELKLSDNFSSHTRGTINIAGKTLPVLSSDQMPQIQHSEITEDSCILLLDSNTSSTEFKVGVLVNDVSEIIKVAHDFN